MMRKCVYGGLLWGICLILCGCSMNYYRAVALRDARDYATDALRELNESEVSFIRFASPEYYAVPLFQVEERQKRLLPLAEVISTRPSGLDQSEKRDIINRHYIGTFVWFLPETERIVLVSGVCGADFSGWAPLKVVHRPLQPANPFKHEALRNVRDFVLSHVQTDDSPALLLSDALQNYIRFSPPKVYSVDSIRGENASLNESEKCYVFAWYDQTLGEGIYVTAQGRDDFKEFRPLTIVNELYLPSTDACRIENFGELSSHRIEDYL